MTIEDRIYTDELSAHAGERVRIAGWLHRVRRLSNVTFVIVRDARGLAQVIVSDATTVAELDGLHAESVIAVTGVVVENAQAPSGYEIHEPAIDVISAASAPPPIDMFRPTLKATLPVLLDNAALTAPSAPPRPLASRRGVRRRLPRHPRRHAIRRDPHAETRCRRDRRRRQRLSRRLLRPPRVPRAEPAVLQADHGRRLRARVRSRPGVPRRTARHHPPPQRVHIPRRRDGLHR